jgi:nicotinamidase-related amidase
MKIKKDNSVAIFIDFQERLFPAMANQEELLSNTKRMVLGMQELSVPLIATQQYTKGLGATLTELSDLIPDFTYVEKTVFSCYDEPAFVELLEAKEAKNVIICGIEAHVCVLQTAVDLKAAGYNPVVVFDCISSRSIQNRDLALERFRFEGIMVTSSESILFELTQSAKASEFKAISKLVK